MKKIAAIVYVPNNPTLIQQFFGLYYSVMIHHELKESVDFIIGCEPGMEYLFNKDNCVVTHCIDLSQDDAYKFKLMNNEVYGYINSWSHFVDDYSIEKILEYPYAL